VGGHCISVDPWFLVELFPKEASLIKAARLINDAMPYFVTKRAVELLQGVKDPKILLLGLAYKANVDDIRESPSFVVYEALRKQLPSATIMASDPHVSSASVPLVSLKDGFHEADLAILLTAHDEFKQLDPQAIGSLMRKRVVFDAHQVLRAEKWVPAGFTVHTLGRGGSKSEKALQS
jgi:UDP-N-acetyl-D-mannosaminuronic acid dehydrogenase